MAGNMLLYILGLSILLQLAAAITALAQMRRSGFHVPWLLISVAVTLMAIRRITSFVGMIRRGAFPSSALGPELIALLISVLMLSGLWMFRPAFLALLRARDEELSAKDLLIRESHHHVKNDLQMLQSLIRLQLNSTENPAARRILQDLVLRVRAFSVLHDYIYHKATSRVSFRDYVGNLVHAISENFSDPRVRLHIDLVDAPIDRRNLLYCGLVINEALTNAYKYAFPPDASHPSISVSDRVVDGRVVVEVRDNGAGVPDEILDGSRSSYGMTLMRGIGGYPGWSLEIIPGSEGPSDVFDAPWPGSPGGPGTRVLFSFPVAAEDRQPQRPGSKAS